MTIGFILGLVSSLHCLQMCGPIVLAYSVSARSRYRAHLAYNCGRIITYTALGILAGEAGAALGLLGRMAGIASAARIISGTAMILAGFFMLPRTGLVKIGRPGFMQSAGRWIAAPWAGSKFALGLAMGFLPCGLIYAALLKAMETGTAQGGGLTMLGFGTGTAAALFGMGVASSFAGARWGAWSNRVAAASVMVFGTILLWRGILARPICHG